MFDSGLFGPCQRNIIVDLWLFDPCQQDIIVDLYISWIGNVIDLNPNL